MGVGPLPLFLKSENKLLHVYLFATKTAVFNSALSGFFRPSSSPVYYWKHPDCATEEGATALRNANIYFAYPLTTPITYQLTPTQLKSLKGVNNIWSDANGNVEIQYWSH